MKRPIVIIGVLFFIFGWVTWLGSVLVPYLRIACQLNNLAAYLVAFALYISYTVMAIPSASLLRRTGYKRGMALGLLIMAAGSLVFIPAALTRWYLLFLVGLFIQGTGLAILQTASNPYVTILGPIETAARRMSIMGICNGIASIAGPVVLASVILDDADGLQAKAAGLRGGAKTALLDGLAHRAILPYSVITVSLLVLSVWIFYSRLPEPDEEKAVEEGTGATAGSIFAFPHLWLGVLTLFLYVGVEVIAGDTIINYGVTQGFALSHAKYFSSATMGCMLLGYLLGIVLIPKYLSHRSVLIVSGCMGLVFAGSALATHGGVSVAFIALLGLANSMVWPSIWPLAIEGLGRFTRIGSSMLIIAIGGGAILPLLYGGMSDIFGARPAYVVLLPCYGAIILYGMWRRKLIINN